MEATKNKPITKSTLNQHKLIVLNDDVNTFDWIILSLHQVCGLTVVNAEQCAYIIHYKGSCSVLTGTYVALKQLKSELISRGIKVVIK
jgi:ATP-dependent Clp protease adaptor protein ClpS